MIDIEQVYNIMTQYLYFELITTILAKKYKKGQCLVSGFSSNLVCFKYDIRIQF